MQESRDYTLVREQNIAGLWMMYRPLVYKNLRGMGKFFDSHEDMTSEAYLWFDKMVRRVSLPRIKDPANFHLGAMYLRYIMSNLRRDLARLQMRSFRERDDHEVSLPEVIAYGGPTSEEDKSIMISGFFSSDDKKPFHITSSYFHAYSPTQETRDSLVDSSLVQELTQKVLKPLQPERKEWLALKRKGWSCAKIAREKGIKYSHVYRFLRETKAQAAQVLGVTK